MNLENLGKKAIVGAGVLGIVAFLVIVMGREDVDDLRFGPPLTVAEYKTLPASDPAEQVHQVVMELYRRLAIHPQMTMNQPMANVLAIARHETRLINIRFKLQAGEDLTWLREFADASMAIGEAGLGKFLGGILQNPGQSAEGLQSQWNTLWNVDRIRKNQVRYIESHLDELLIK